MNGRQHSKAGRAATALAATLPLVTLVSGLATASPGTPPRFEYTRSSVATADFGDARLGGTENRIAYRGAPRPTGKGEFRWALDYGYQRYEYSGLASRNRDLHRLEMPLIWRSHAPLAWTVELRPVIATSSNVFKDLWSRGGSDDLGLHGRVLRELAPRGAGWGWRAGAAYDDAFGKEQLYPLVALLREHGGMRIEFGWPVTRALLAVGHGIEAGGEVAPAGGRWHVVSDERDGASFDYEVRAWRAGAILRWQSAEGLVLTTRAGLEFERRHRLEDDLGATVNRSVAEAGFLAIGVGYRW